MKLSRVLALAAVVLLVSSCAQGVPGKPALVPSEPPEGPGVLGGTQWRLSELNGGAPVIGSSITIQFSEEGVVTGSSGCNRFRAGFDASDRFVVVKEPMAQTMMACDEKVMQQEATFLEAFGTATAFTMTEEQLTLLNASGDEVARFAVDSQGLEDTEWAVVSYNDGKEAVVSVLEGSDPKFAFDGEGAISGTGGCNRITGKYTAEDGTIKINKLGMTRMACPEPDGVMDQEDAILKALGTAATYRVEGDSLEMRTKDDAIALVLSRA